MSLLAVGTVAFDTIETPTDSRQRILGGSATYFSYAASFFTPVRLVGMVGQDWPDRYSQLLSQRQIDLSGLVKNETRNTYFWHGRYTPDLQDRETLACEVNGFDRYEPLVPDHFRDSSYVFLGAAIPQVQMRTLSQCASPKFVFADTVDMWIERARDDLLQLLPRLGCLFINDAEARQLTLERDLISAGRSLQALGARMVIIKKGEHGCLWFGDGTVAAFPAYPTNPIVDPTGAGDSFAGGLIGYLVQQGRIDNQTMRHAIHYGTVMASFCVEGFSLEGLLRITIEELESRKKAYRHMLVGE